MGKSIKDLDVLTSILDSDKILIEKCFVFPVFFLYICIK